MARGQDTGRHPGRQVGRPAFGPVVVRQEARDMTDQEKAEFSKWTEDSNLQGRYEGMDRGVNFPLGKY
jgi:hypothetical protein